MLHLPKQYLNYKESKAMTQPILRALPLLLLALPILGHAEDTKVTEREIAVPKCDRPAAKVMFSEIKCKAADCYGGGGRQRAGNSNWWNPGAVNTPGYGGIGSGLGEMLATALTQTGCFEVMERSELEDVQRELALTGKKVQLESADYIISGSITSLGFDQSGTGVGALVTRFVPVLGGLEYKSTKAHLNLDLRLIDTQKAKILASKTFQGDNQRTGFGIGGIGFAGGVALGGNHSSVSGTPLEEVARDVLVRATVFITNQLASRNITERIVLKASDRDKGNGDQEVN